MFCLRARRGTIFGLEGIAQELCRQASCLADECRDALSMRRILVTAGKSVRWLAAKAAFPLTFGDR